MRIELIKVRTSEEWEAFHEIRRTVLFEARGRFGVYDPHYPDDHIVANHPLLLIENGHPRGALRLDFQGDRAVVRTVAVHLLHQRRGLGRAMMQLVERYTVKNGIAVLTVNSARDAVPFYLRLGWTMLDAECESPILEMRMAGPTGLSV